MCEHIRKTVLTKEKGFFFSKSPYNVSHVPPSNVTTKRVVQGGLSHGSRTEKITNHGSRISKFHFPESRK